MQVAAKVKTHPVKGDAELEKWVAAHSGVFGVSEPDQSKKLLQHLQYADYKDGEHLFVEGDESDHLYAIVKGGLALYTAGTPLLTFLEGECCGELGILQGRPRRGTMTAVGSTRIISLETTALFGTIRKDMPDVAASIFYYLGKRVTTMSTGYDVYRNIDVLLIQDGGSAPGSNPVTAYLTEFFNAAGRRVFAAKTGYHSLCNGTDNDFCFLVSDENAFNSLNLLPRCVYTTPLKRARGANFREERWPQFKEAAMQKRACQVLKERHVRVVVCIGGNGTFAGVRSLTSQPEWPENCQVFFIPATIDNDVSGTECLGKDTAVEMGADKLRCYHADARTHHRAYILEMMGRDSGFHCLHSVLGAGVHMAVTPSSKLDLPLMAKAITVNKDSVIAVAEGYCRKERDEAKFKGCAADWLLEQLRKTGNLDENKRKVVTEPFSRDIRGAAPNNLDILLAQRMAKAVVEMALLGHTRRMPTVNAGVVKSQHFDQISTNNEVDPLEEELANKLFVTFRKELHAKEEKTDE